MRGRHGRLWLLAVYAAAVAAAALLIVAPPRGKPTGAAVAAMAPLGYPPSGVSGWLAFEVALPPPGRWIDAAALAACGWYGKAAAVVTAP